MMSVVVTKPNMGHTQSLEASDSDKADKDAVRR